MYFKLNTFISLLLYSMIVVPIQATEQKNKEDISSTTLDIQPSIEFTALPEQCVTLRQGRNCFTEINIQWKSYTEQTLCLYQKGITQQLRCWQNDKKAAITIEFISNKSISYQLRSLPNDTLVAETHVTVSWLHKTNIRKRRWRLF